MSDKVLAHCDPQLPITLAYDASSYELGAVISHIDSDGNSRPIAHASRTLTEAEKNCCQIDKEELAIIFGIKKKLINICKVGNLHLLPTINH